MQMDIHPFSIVENTRVRFPNFNPNDAYGSHAIGVSISGWDSTELSADYRSRHRCAGNESRRHRHRDECAEPDSRWCRGRHVAWRPRNDIYLFDRGDGVDTIVDTAVAGAMMKSGSAPV